jgi:hypothetical protein
VNHYRGFLSEFQNFQNWHLGIQTGVVILVSTQILIKFVFIIKLKVIGYKLHYIILYYINFRTIEILNGYRLMNVSSIRVSTEELVIRKNSDLIVIVRLDLQV